MITRVATFVGSNVEMTKRAVYTVAEIAALTGFSRRTITRMFRDERGVLILERPETLHNMVYRSICIPRAVHERVINRLTIK
jgi:hypothetical protein